MSRRRRLSLILSVKDLHDPKIAAIIATKLREFHDLDMPGPKKVLLWDRLKNYLKMAKRLSSSEEAKEFYLDMIEEEISSLKNELLSEDQMIGFCHNDLWYDNMIMNEETKMLTIIDYELACFNPVAFDIASYFCEMATDFNTEALCIWNYNKYPNLDVRKRFVQIYLNSSAGEDPKDAEVETLLKNIEKYILACHLYCALGIMTLRFVNLLVLWYLALFTAGGLASRIINVVNHGARGDCKIDDVKVRQPFHRARGDCKTDDVKIFFQFSLRCQEISNLLSILVNWDGRRDKGQSH